MLQKNFLYLLLGSLLLIPNSTFANFKDVGTFHTYQDSINKLAKQGCITGYQDGTFKPDNSITRAETLKLLLQCLDIPKIYSEEKFEVPAGSTYVVNDKEIKLDSNSTIKIKVPFDPNTYPDLEFIDIKGNEWYVNTLKEALVRKIITGYSDNTVKPTKTVSKGEFFSFLYRLVPKELQQIDTSKNIAKDVDPNEWFANGLIFAQQQNLIGIDINGNISPFKELNRGQVAHFIQLYKDWLNKALNPIIEVKVSTAESPPTTEENTKATTAIYDDTYLEEGVASYYDTALFEGKRTAAGDIYDPTQFTAAHNDLPFGTIVKVTDKASGKFVCVKINDRGPNKTIHPDRIIDLSANAFAILADLSKGVIQVKLELKSCNS